MWFSIWSLEFRDLGLRALDFGVEGLRDRCRFQTLSPGSIPSAGMDPLEFLVFAAISAKSVPLGTYLKPWE